MKMDDLLNSVDEQNEAKKNQQDKKTQLDTVAESGNKVTAAVNTNTQSTAQGLKNVKGEVKVTNPDLAKTSDLNNVVDSINKMNVTTFMSTHGFHDMAENITRLSDEVQTLQKNLQDQGLTSISSAFDSLVKRLEATSKVLVGTKVSVDNSVTKSIDSLSKAIQSIDFNPSVNVTAPETKVVTTPVDLSAVVTALGKVEQTIKDTEKEETELNLSPVISGLTLVQKAIQALRFPVPNYVLPFKDNTGKAIQVQLGADGSLPISLTSDANRLATGDQLTTITSSTSATTIVSAVASTFCDLTSLVLSNISATATEVQLYNDDGTTQRMNFYVPANDVRGIVFSTPFTQAATNKTWKLKTITSVASLVVAAQFIKNT